MLDTNTCYYICRNLCSNGTITAEEVIAVIFDMFADNNIRACMSEDDYVDMFTAKLAEFKNEKEKHMNNNVVEIRGL